MIVAGLVVLASVGCNRTSNVIDYRGEKIKLTRFYTDYDEYKNDPNNIDPTETDRVQYMVMSAPIAHSFNSKLDASKAIGEIAFPGYGSGGFTETAQSDGSKLTGFSVEIPRAGKERYFVFKGNNGRYTLIDDFIASESQDLIQSVVRRNDELVFRSPDGREMFSRAYSGN
jgi:hypothetical protein